MRGGGKGDKTKAVVVFPKNGFSLTLFVISLSVERTEKIPLGSIKTVISEPIKGHEEYHIMVSPGHKELPPLCDLRIC